MSHSVKSGHRHPDTLHPFRHRHRDGQTPRHHTQHGQTPHPTPGQRDHHSHPTTPTPHYTITRHATQSLDCMTRTPYHYTTIYIHYTIFCIYPHEYTKMYCHTWTHKNQFLKNCQTPNIHNNKISNIYSHIIKNIPKNTDIHTIYI